VIREALNLEPRTWDIGEKILEKDKNSGDKSSTLQDRAEAFINKTSSAVKKVPPQDIKNIVEELQIHQVELEMQNEELRRAQRELQESSDRVSDLYDFAPVGYFTVSYKGLIQEANLTGAAMLGVERRNLINQPFSRFITTDTRDIFCLHRQKIIETRTRQGCELKLRKKDGTEFHAQLECVVVEDGEGNIVKSFRVAVSDIQERKRANEVLKQRTHDLDERVKELNCLYGISSLIEKPDISLYEIIQGAVDLIPSSWQYPEITSARILLEDNEYKTENFEETNWKQSNDIVVYGKRAGVLEICYLEERPEIDEGPFVKEERSLIKVITERLGHIIERKQAEEALRESEANFRRISENVPAVVYQLKMTPDGMFTLPYVNDTVESIMGVTVEDAMRDSSAIMNMIHPEDEKMFREGIMKSAETLGKYHEIFRILKDGEVLWLECRAMPNLMTNGNILWDGFFIDITDRKQAQEELRKSEHRFRQTAELLPNIVCEMELNLRLTYVNNLGLETFGYTRDEFDAGINATEIICPEDREKAATYTEQLVNGAEAGIIEYRMIKKDGSEFFALTNASLIHEDGQILGIRASLTDITEQKKIQEELLKAQKMEAISTLAGGIAHEFNNALMGIMGNIELLKIDLPEDERRDRFFEAMTGSGHRMSRLTDQLLAYAKGGKYQPKDLKLDDFVIETLPIMQHELSPEVRVETHFPKDLSFVNADSAQMQMVLSAILANSNEAIEDEGIIRISAENKDVDDDLAKQLPGLKPGPYVCLTVEDDGKGMDEQTRSGIFEPFFTTKFQGRGMGMAAVYGIVKNHDGQIYVDSELGKGTTVRIYLPAISAESREQGAVKKPETELGTGKGTILMIEDEDMVIDVTRTMLEMLGYRVMVAKTGKDAIHIAETFDGQIDLALLDIKLPDISGINLYPLIMKARSNLKVIVWSGYSIDGPAREILDAGAQDFIHKPFTLATLSEKLKEVLGGE